MVYRNEPGQMPHGRAPQDSRQKFAELLRRAERNGERIRLTRNGAPFAYIVPLADGERLKRFDDMARRMEESGSGAAAYAPEPPLQGVPGGVPAHMQGGGQPQGMQPNMGEGPSSPYDSAFPEHGGEDERQVAIAAFKKTIERIIGESDPITRAEMSRRIRHDGYIATAVRKIIGEG